MLLYVIYVEPFLLLLERKLKGLVFSGQPQNALQSQSQLQVMKQVSEAFCDDVNLLVTCYEDLHVIGDAVIHFEKASGAILSHNIKCLVLGLGRWSSRTNWILNYLQPVKEIKVFGILFMNDYHN